MKEKIEQISGLIQEYKQHIDISILMAAPFIVEVGFLTVTTDENKNAIFRNLKYPHQFSKEGVVQILKHKHWNGDGKEVAPKVYLWKQWYVKRIKEMEDTLKIFEEVAI